MIRRFTTFLPVLLVLGTTGIPTPARAEGVLQALEQEIAQLFAQNRECVVRIHAIYAPAGTQSETLQYGSGYTHGTGFLFDPAGYVMTVDKAVAGAREIRVTLANGDTYAGTLVASDPASDVAVIHVDAADLPCVRCGNSDEVRIGHYSFILGNAFGHLMPSIGSVHEVNRDEDLIQLATTVHPSYGGAPVFNSAGQVVGMVWAAPFQPRETLASLTQEAPMTVFVLPINRAERIARELIRQGRVNYGWLGVEVDEGSLPVVVTRVAEDGPAYRAGIRAGDQIVSFGGRTVAGPYHLRRMVMETKPGTSVPIRLVKGDGPVSAEVEVTERADARTAAHRLSDFEPAGAQAAVSDASGDGQSALYQQIRAVELELGRLRRLIKR